MGARKTANQGLGSVSNRGKLGAQILGPPWSLICGPANRKAPRRHKRIDGGSVLQVTALRACCTAPSKLLEGFGTAYLEIGIVPLRNGS